MDTNSKHNMEEAINNSGEQLIDNGNLNNPIVK